MSANTAVALINCSILLMVAVVSVTGFVALGSPVGLVSMFALLLMMKTSTPEKH